MGSTAPTIQYAVPVTQKKDGQTAVFRYTQFKDSLSTSSSQDIKTMKDSFIKSFKKFANNQCLGTIIREKVDDKKVERVEFIKYSDLQKQATWIGSGIYNEKLYYQPEGEAHKFVGLFSRNRPEWTIIDVASSLYGYTIVPIYDTLGDQNISYVFNHTNLTTVFVNDISIKALMKTQDMGNVKNIVSFDQFSEQQEAYFKEKGISLIKYSSVINNGKQNKQNYEDQQFAVKPLDCISFCYTSGTTGPPKGAMLSHQNFTSFLAALDRNYAKFGEKDRVLSYLPLPHVLQRECSFAMLANGGSIVYFSGDTQKIKDDVSLVKPTIFVSVPRLFSRFYQIINKKFDDVKGYGKTALDYGLGVKLKNTTTNGGYTHKVYDTAFFNKTKAALGGNVRLMISGSAPLLPDVHAFMKVVMCCPLLEGYGQTESTGAAFITHPNDPMVGHIGGPVASFEYKLVDVPEMKYTSQDKDEEGRPMPRGQIWMRGPGVFLGYYKNEEKTKEAMTEDGWLKSGDIGAILPKTKCLKIIDRKKNIFKLQQGQYVAAQKVEMIYQKCHNIAQVFLHGESTESFAVVIVTPQKEYIEQQAKQKGIEGSWEQLCKNKAIRTELLKELNAIGKQQGLKSFQMAKNIYLEPVNFLSHEILTNTMKVQRHEAKKVYAEGIKQMYSQGMLPTDKQKK